MRRHVLVSIVVAAVGGCDGSGPPAHVIPPDDPVPAGCRTMSAPEVPLVALPWNRSLDTYLVPDRTYDSVAIDYDVRPRQQLVSVRLAYDYDPLSQPEPLTIETECVQTIGFDQIASPVTEDDVVSMQVTARGHAGDDRIGRLSYSRGTGELTIRTDGLDTGDPELPWFFVFEPAAGDARIILSPARLDRTTLSVRGLPVVPGVVALIQTEGLVVDNVSGAIYTPTNFAMLWRQRARGWYGRVLASWPEPGETVVLETIIAPTTTRERSRPLGDVVTLDAAHPVMFVEVPPQLAASRIEAPCDSRAVILRTTGYVVLDARAGDVQRHVEPGGAVDVPVACAAGETTASIDLAIRNLNWRYSTLIASLEPEAM